MTLANQVCETALEMEDPPERRLLACKPASIVTESGFRTYHQRHGEANAMSRLNLQMPAGSN